MKTNKPLGEGERGSLYAAAVEESLDSWFTREIAIHEESLLRYLYRTWPNKDEVLDLRQEIYVRVYEAAAKVRPRGFIKAFLFTIARNLMTDRIRQQRIVAINAMGDLDSLNVTADCASPEQRTSAEQDLRRLAEAIDLLPPKCRETVWLRRVAELSQREVAVRLGISEKTVEGHIAKGMKILTAALFGADGKEHGRR